MGGGCSTLPECSIGSLVRRLHADFLVDWGSGERWPLRALTRDQRASVTQTHTIIRTHIHLVRLNGRSASSPALMESQGFMPGPVPRPSSHAYTLAPAPAATPAQLGHISKAGTGCAVSSSAYLCGSSGTGNRPNRVSRAASRRSSSTSYALPCVRFGRKDASRSLLRRTSSVAVAALSGALVMPRPGTSSIRSNRDNAMSDCEAGSPPPMCNGPKFGRSSSSSSSSASPDRCLPAPGRPPAGQGLGSGSIIRSTIAFPAS